MRSQRLRARVKSALRSAQVAQTTTARPVKETVAAQLAKAMEKKKISKSQMAELLKTSRSQVDRLLDRKSDVTLSSLQRAAALVGRRVVVELD